MQARHEAIEKMTSDRVRVLDPKFRRYAARYVLQCLAATVAIFLVLSLLDAVTQTVLIAALGASTFIAFTMPHVKSARPRYLVGGYCVGIFSGCLVSMSCGHVVAALAPAAPDTVALAGAAVATGLAMFLMVITDSEHPPAAALALGFVLNEWDLLTVTAVMLGILSIATIKELWKSRMLDLL